MHSCYAQPTYTTSTLRSGQFPNNIRSHMPDPIPLLQGRIQSLALRRGSASRSSRDSWDIPRQIYQVPSRSSGISVQSAGSSPRSSQTNLSVPCVIQSANDSSTIPRLIQPNNATRPTGAKMVIPPEFSELVRQS